MRAIIAAVAVLGVAAILAVAAPADTVPFQDSPDLPWTNPTHESALELTLTRIAAHIAEKDVKVRCQGETDWRKLVLERGGDPNAELGYVGVDFSRRTGQLRWLADFAELAGDTICLPLKTFAVATTKPTKCVVTRLQKTTVLVRKRVGGVVKRVPTVVTRKVQSPPERCYLGARRIARAMPDAYWEAYWEYANAILTVAHEAIHLGGTVGGRLGNGVIAGDVDGEAKANCYGMQWMPYVAQELGASPEDAQAIAWFYWDNIYPSYKGSAYGTYWSADCRPGGRLDIRPAGKKAWP